MENELKKQSGLYDEASKEYKSFANCSREQLGNAIQVLITIGEDVGLNLR